MTLAWADFMDPVDFSSMLRSCELCPRKCGADRARGKKGFCGAGRGIEVFRYAPHRGEEPPVSGSRGSGTVFFSRCTMRCLYCQNYPWSQEGAGQSMESEALADVLQELADRGCHNWNLVSPTPWLPGICRALESAKAGGRSLPVVYNTSGYERPEILRGLEGAVDIYLADLRYADPESAREGSGAADYVECARAALEEMWRQAGKLETTPDGVGISGLICRILVLPGRAEEACRSIRWLADNFGPEVAVSVMAQYVPAYRAGQYPEWNRRVSPEEYRGVCREFEKGGFAMGWIQEYDERPDLELAGFNMPAMDMVPGEA